jgi:hypothetical protein
MSFGINKSSRNEPNFEAIFDDKRSQHTYLSCTAHDGGRKLWTPSSVY